LLPCAWALAQAPTPPPLSWDQSKSVYNRRIRPAEPTENVNWAERVTALLKEQPGDIVITAVGDMIFNEQISRLPEPYHQQLFRLMQEADIGYGNLEFSLNSHPELQRPFYNFRADPQFAWEVAAIGINLVSMANNHALDFGPEGLKECLSRARCGCRARRPVSHCSPTCATGPRSTAAPTRLRHAWPPSTRRPSSSPRGVVRSRPSKG
jgi:hypothetical protein